MILTVEDNPRLREVVVGQLRQLGYRCLEAEDGPSALRLLEAESVDLLFTDVMMPGGLTGHDLCRIARQRWPSMRLLLTSGSPEAVHNRDGFPESPRMLAKPYRRDELARTLTEVLSAPRD